MGKAKEDAGAQTSGVKKGTEYRYWLAKLPYSIVILDQDNTILYANPALFNLTCFN